MCGHRQSGDAEPDLENTLRRERQGRRRPAFLKSDFRSKACSSINSPLEVLRNHAPCFIWANSRAPKHPWFSSVRLICNVTRSASRKSSIDWDDDDTRLDRTRLDLWTACEDLYIKSHQISRH